MADFQRYFPEFFIPNSLEHAKEIIIPAGGKDPEFRWNRETRETTEKIIKLFEKHEKPIGKGTVLIDYGCGIGRIAKTLIDQTGCTIIGADISPRMLDLAFRYVNSERFIVCPAVALPTLLKTGFRADGAIACWTYQHCLQPDHDIKLTADLLKQDGMLFVLNETVQRIPVNSGDEWVHWVGSGQDVSHNLKNHFIELEDSPFSPELTERLPVSFAKLFKK